MLSTNNVFSPANGAPIISPSQDMVLGIYYLTKGSVGKAKQSKRYGSLMELFLAYGHADTRTHGSVQVKMEPRRLIKQSRGAQPVPVGDDGKLQDGDKRSYVTTTVGRALFNDILPPGMP